MKPVHRSAINTALALLVMAPLSIMGEQPDVVLTPHTNAVRTLCRNGDTLFVGTGGGLYLYDLSVNILVDKMIVGDRLPSSSVRAIEARNDSVFVGTDRGLSIIVGDSVHIFSDEHHPGYDAIALDDIVSIDFGLDGAWYLGTFGHGLSVVDGDTSWVITRDDSLLDDKVFGTVQEDDTTFYYATSMGLCAYRDSAWVGFQAGAGIPRGEVRDIIRSDEVGYFLLVGGWGVYVFDGFDARRISPEDLFHDGAVSAIALDPANRLWASGRWGGLAVYENRNWKRVLEREDDVNKREWLCAYADFEGNVFFGGADGTVIMIQGNYTRRIVLPPALPAGNANSLVETDDEIFFLNGSQLHRAAGSTLPLDPTVDLAELAAAPDGSLWAAGRWGLYRREAGVLREFPVDAAEADAAYSSLCFDRNGWLWVASRSGAVYRFDGQMWMRVGDSELLGSGQPGRLVAGGGGVWIFWTGSDSPGCARYRGGIWKTYADSFAGLPVADVAESPNGRLIAATSNALWGYDSIEDRWKAIRFVNLNGDSGLPGEWPRRLRVTAICFDARGRLYLGTNDGIAVSFGDETKFLDAARGLGGMAVSDLIVQGEDYLWIGYESDGLARVRLKSLWP